MTSNGRAHSLLSEALPLLIICLAVGVFPLPALLVGLELVLEVFEELRVPLWISVHVFDEKLVHPAIVELYAINQSICIPEREETAAASLAFSFLERKILRFSRLLVLRN